jgi:hypothetical protein
MPTNHRRELAGIKRFDQLVAYLRDEMDWPIEGDDFEDLTFEYTPEELGIDAKNAAKIQEIKRLRPLAPEQPWGIFFVKFEPKRLPVVALRRILSRVVLKKRATANSDDRAAWEMADLLFISNYGDKEERRISFAHFVQDDDWGDLPTLKVLGWDADDTGLHLDDVAAQLTTKLRWPPDESDVETWRATWASAFPLRNREVITTSKRLAEALAGLARATYKKMRDALAIEAENGPLRKLMDGFKKALIHDLDDDGFADMYAQTIAYGLLSARISRPAGLTADNMADLVPVTNPFLKEMLQSFLRLGGRRRSEQTATGIDFDELGINEMVQLLRDANMEAVVRDFGDKNPEEDPVIHFYEDFIAQYDPKRRKQRGVFYTPRPVVSYIVRSVDELLRTEFGLEDGLADTTTWGEMAERHADLKIPAGVSPHQAFVQILDPATGTGTFLVEVIDLIHRTMVAKWQAEGHREKQIVGLWNEYVPKHLLPRLHGYELMMAPYAIAHLKIGLKLHETGYLFGSDQRARIYLTNALEPGTTSARQMEFKHLIPALAHEAEAVQEIKTNHRFTVIAGNPPYANYSANLALEARRIVDRYRNFRGVPIRERNQLQFERNIQDDFVKFMAIAEDLVGASGAGVVGLITNGTMLASTSLRGMRESLSDTFDRLFELHLHGGGNEIIDEARDDENVFDIIQAVAIHVYVRSGHGGAARINYADLLGRRSIKYTALASQSVSLTNWREIEPDIENHGFVPQDENTGVVGRRLDSAFVKFGAGIKTNRDAVAIGFDELSLLDSVREFDDKVVSGKFANNRIYPILYRPFDVRKVFYHKDVVASRSLPTMKHVIAGPNIGLICSSTWTTPDRFSVGISRLLVEMKTGTHDRGTTFFPLYRYDVLMGGTPNQVHNLSSVFLEEWRATTGKLFLPTGRGDGESTTGPEDILLWLYCLFHSIEYRRRYRAALAQGFPVVLLTSNMELLRKLVLLGDKLVALHLLESPALDQLITEPVGDRKPEVEKPTWSQNTVYVDKRKTNGFKGVYQEVWNFHIGGYQVCHKWLKDRKGRTLSDDDIAHYQRIIVAISETIRLMGEIDEVIEKHGGWPGAFQTSKQ